MHGWGLYFAKEARYSNNYACTHPDGTKGMFIVEVATGNAYDVLKGTQNTGFLKNAP